MKIKWTNLIGRVSSLQSADAGDHDPNQPTKMNAPLVTTQEYVDHCLAKRDEARDKAIYSAVFGEPIQAAKDLSAFHAAWALHAQAVGNLA